MNKYLDLSTIGNTDLVTVYVMDNYNVAYSPRDMTRIRVEITLDASLISDMSKREVQDAVELKYLRHCRQTV